MTPASTIGKQALIVIAGFIPLHISAQNAGILISNSNGRVIFETFELSPRNEDVMSTKGRLRRSFPGSALSIPSTVFEEAEFQRTLAFALASMSWEAVAGTQPKTKKAGREHDEKRDTTHPKMVTEFLVTFLLAQGGSQTSSIVIGKNTREDVVFKDALIPWRRSPLWLFIRVTIQLVLNRLITIEDDAEHLYKDFLIFFMAGIARQCDKEFIESDLLSVINFKLNRRVLKRGSVLPNLRLYVDASMKQINATLQQRWSTIQDKQIKSLPLNALPALDFQRDSRATLVELDDFIAGMSERPRITARNVFSPSYATSIFAEATVLPHLSFLSNEEHDARELVALEQWVAKHLNAWLKVHKLEGTTSRSLRVLMEAYYAQASSIYNGNPESTSIMILTLLDLWMACDLATVKACPLLAEYDHGLSHEVLQNLILPFKDQLERLDRVEKYLISRRGGSTKTSADVFDAFGSPSSFAVRYFHQSTSHQVLMRRIQSEAEKKRQQKRAEFKMLKQSYNDLVSRSARLSCDFYKDYNSYAETFREVHSPHCHKCNLQEKAECLSIEVYEWPLPSNDLNANSVVFELLIPDPFDNWRDATAFIALDVLHMKYATEKRPRRHYTLQGYEGLQDYNTFPHTPRRITLLSEAKSHPVSHYKVVSISSSSEYDVCVNNGMQWQYYDEGQGCFTCGLTQANRLAEKCTYPLPNNSPLRQFIFRPPDAPSGPPPNTVIATQHLCPNHMSTEEFRALCTIPLGFGIQWQNILVQLNAPLVDFMKVETEVFLLQCAGQVGPRETDTALRASHHILEHPVFGEKLITGIKASVHGLEKNWLATSALGVLTFLTTHLLSVSPFEEIKRRCCTVLEHIRRVTLEWTNGLREKVQMSLDNETRNKYRVRAGLAALVCAGTLYVDDDLLAEAMQDSDTSTDFLECCIIVQESQGLVEQLSHSASLMYARWKRLCQRASAILAEQIVMRTSNTLDRAIKRSWSAYKDEGGWRELSADYPNWLIKDIGTHVREQAVQVQFDLLSGELLVNGVPLNRLPGEYERHYMYQKLFGRTAIEVMPSTHPGMQFSSKREYSGWTVHFGLSDSHSHAHDLLIRASKNKEEFELIPPRVFRLNFSSPLVNDQVHWYSLNRNAVEFRTAYKPWKSSLDNWELRAAGKRWQLRRNDQVAVDQDSETGKTLRNIFNSLELPSWVQAFYTPALETVDIELPRMHLGFKVVKGEATVRSKEFSGMSIDNDQTTGALVGLKSKLVINDKTAGNKRMIIIPAGEELHKRVAGHTEVHIKPDTVTKAYAYGIDDLLGRLVDNGTKEGKLFLAYLHALTTFCLPDPLTGRTGTEEALEILNSAALKSFDQFSCQDISILMNLASITPRREYYPKHERVMQTVEWSTSLGFGAQHGGFLTSVQRIFNRIERSKFFYPDTLTELPKIPGVDNWLLERDDIRSSAFRVSGYGAESFTDRHDGMYDGRDRWETSEKIQDVFRIARSFHRGVVEHPELSTEVPESHFWDLLSTFPAVHGPVEDAPSWRLEYSGRWLTDTSFVLENWVILHQVLRGDFGRVETYRVALWLSTLAFGGNIDRHVLYLLAEFFLSSRMSDINIPLASRFQPRQGVEPTASKLTGLLSSQAKPLHRCPENLLRRLDQESKASYNRRKKSTFDRNCFQAIDALAEVLKEQWPCETPQFPDSRNQSHEWNTYIYMSNAMISVRSQFYTWFANRSFRGYLCQLGATLSCPSAPLIIPNPSMANAPRNHKKDQLFIGREDIFSRCAPQIPDSTCASVGSLLDPKFSAKKNQSRLPALINQLSLKAETSFEKEYIEKLEQSSRYLEAHSHKVVTNGIAHQDCLPILMKHYVECKCRVEEILRLLTASARSITPGDTSYQSVPNLYQLPRTGAALFLQQLRRKQWSRLSAAWKKCLVQYALALIHLQQATRLLSLADNKRKLVEELQNTGHTNWNPYQDPEFLLLEVGSNIMIREVQAEIAAEMRKPTTGSNTVMQLNMGEGKSSVIVPMVAGSLAEDGTLVRVVVGRPQAKQMLDMLVNQLGGLPDRPIFHTPISRAIKLGTAEAEAIHGIYEDCMREGGVLLVQPEHILSFKLMAIERANAHQDNVSSLLFRSQEFLNKSSRDIVDESDENFDVKLELVYPIGTQRPIDHSPARWDCIQHVLGIFKDCLPYLEQHYPGSLQICRGREGCSAGSFPRTRLLRDDVKQAVVEQIAERIVKEGMAGFPMANRSMKMKKTILTYLTKRKLTEAEIDQTCKEDGWTKTAKTTLFLLRGLLAGGVLVFALSQKRWRVNYGLCLERTPQTKLAVPFTAKDKPSPRSEFSHPEVVLLLTMLSYYYGGLRDEELYSAFSRLQRSDQASTEYQSWVKDADGLPDTFHQLAGVNVEDDDQCTRSIFPRLRFAKSVIDFYLAHVVFPAEMKEFPKKLSASGWDIAEVKKHVTTGFSGTNDSRVTLPLSIQQLDLDKQKHTNALVMEHLLQPENVVQSIPEGKGGGIDASTFLSMVVGIEPEVRVILDVGAQIIELRNRDVAERWLKMLPSNDRTQAAVFFDENDHLCVLDRKGKIDLLGSSPFATRLDVCLVFLDEAHTRGTDLRLPHDYRAAVTLGANLTKDRLVQGK